MSKTYLNSGLKKHLPRLRPRWLRHPRMIAGELRAYASAQEDEREMKELGLRGELVRGKRRPQSLPATSGW